MELTKLLRVGIRISKAETTLGCVYFQHIGGVRMWGFTGVSRKSVKIRKLNIGHEERHCVGDGQEPYCVLGWARLYCSHK